MANLWLKPVISKKGFHEQVTVEIILAGLLIIGLSWLSGLGSGLAAIVHTDPDAHVHAAAHTHPHAAADTDAHHAVPDRQFTEAA